MTTARLSNLTFELVQGRISNVLSRGGESDPWVAELMRAAGFDLHMNPEDEDGIYDQLGCWLSDTSAQASISNLALVGETGKKICDPRIVRLLLAAGVNPTALLALSEIVQGQVAADIPLLAREGDLDAPQAGLVPGEMSDELMVPLDPDVYWTGERLLVRDSVVPQAVLATAIGRSATYLVNHPALADAGQILGVSENQGNYNVLLLAPADMLPWSDVPLLK